MRAKAQRLITISTPYGTKRVHYRDSLEALEQAASRYGWVMRYQGGRAVMVDPNAAQCAGGAR